jgi:hypothetical protein
LGTPYITNFGPRPFRSSLPDVPLNALPVRNAPMFNRTLSALCLTRLRRHRQKFGLRRLTLAILAAVGASFLFYFFAVPQLIRFRFRASLSKYDLGFYGFGPSLGFVSFDEETRVVEISPADAKCDPRYTFIAPRGDSVAHAGPMILDARGELVWAKYNWGTTQDFKVQRFKGHDYVTYWQGDEEDGHGRGSWYMVGSKLQILSWSSLQSANAVILTNSWTRPTR